MPIERSAPRSFLAVLAGAVGTRASGLVRVRQGEGRLSVALSAGRIVAFEAEGRPGALLSEEDSELAALLAEAFAEGDPSLSRAAARQTLLEALRSAEARAELEEGTVQATDPPLDLVPEDLLREAGHACDMALVDEALGPLDRTLELRIEPQALPTLTLTPSEAYLVSRLDGALTATAVLDLLPQEPETARRNLFGLVVAGIVGFGEAERPAPSALPPPVSAGPEGEARRQVLLEAHARIVPERDHFRVLGVAREASEAEVKAAYFRLAKLYHPDTLGDLLDQRETQQAIFARISAAFDVLGQPRTRAAYEERQPAPTSASAYPPPTETGWPHRPPPSVTGPPLPPSSAASPEDQAWLAEEALRRAEGLLTEGRFWEAIQTLEGHLPALAGRSRHRGRLVLAQAYMHNPKWLHRAEELLRGVVKDEPLNAEAYYLLGTIYKTGGLPTRAAAMFRKVLEARPGHKPASDELAAMEKAPPPPRRWFRGPGGGEEEG